MAMHYLDFDLSIEAIDSTPGRYRARVLDSPAGEASIEFVLPFSAVELENYILKMGRPRQGVRGLNSTEGRAAQEFGRKLYDTIFQDAVRDCLRRSLDAANQQPQHGLRLRLRLLDAPALADWPWEYLYDTAFRRFFAHSAATPIVRYLELPQRIQPLAMQPPLQILVMIANPRDVGYLDVEDEWRKIQAALADLVQRGLVTLTRLENATLASLQRQLRQQQYHIFHFVGHGGFDQQTQEGVLLLENENGLVRMVAGSYIGALFHDHRSLRLAVLNACEGARTAQSDPFAGVAQTLVQQGIPAVIAMQFEITDQAAITFSHEFYSALADRYPVDGALAEARKAIYAAGNDVEWGTPVLYLRAQDGNIFQLTELPVAPLLPTPQLPPELPPEPVQPPIKSIADWRPNWLWTIILILLVIGGVLGGQRLFAVLWPLPTETPTPVATMTIIPTDTGTATETATATVTTATPDLTTTAQAILALQTASAATETALAPTATVTPVATSIIMPTATSTLTPTATISLTNTPTVTLTPAVTLTLTSTVTDTPTVTVTNTVTPQSTNTPSVVEPAAGVTKTIEGITFVYVPAGEFTMGSDAGNENEKPMHTVDLAGFWIMQTEVTNEQYKQCVNAEMCTAPGNDTWESPEASNYPVTHVDWEQANTYAEWLGGQLPSEAQWEKAACGTDGRIYPWGNDAPTDQRLNYNNQLGRTTEVGSYSDSQSPYGALDMAGNVWEWTSSQYQAYPYQADDGRETRASAGRRVARGGSFGLGTDVRCAYRLHLGPSFRVNYLGLRVISAGG